MLFVSYSQILLYSFVRWICHHLNYSFIHLFKLQVKFWLIWQMMFKKRWDFNPYKMKILMYSYLMWNILNVVKNYLEFIINNLDIKLNIYLTKQYIISTSHFFIKKFSDFHFIIKFCLFGTNMYKVKQWLYFTLNVIINMVIYL